MGLMKQRWTQIVDEEAVDMIVEEDMDENDPLQALSLLAQMFPAIILSLYWGLRRVFYPV